MQTFGNEYFWNSFQSTAAGRYGQDGLPALTRVGLEAKLASEPVPIPRLIMEGEGAVGRVRKPSPACWIHVQVSTFLCLTSRT